MVLVYLVKVLWLSGVYSEVCAVYDDLLVPCFDLSLLSLLQLSDHVVSGYEDRLEKSSFRESRWAAEVHKEVGFTRLFWVKLGFLFGHAVLQLLNIGNLKCVND